MRIDPKAAREIEAAFAAAQARTAAPLACVVADCSADYALGPSLGAAALALATPWPLIAFADLPAVHVFAAQLAVFAVALAVLAFAPVRAALASRARRRSACHRAAVVQFALRGLDRAAARNGVLLYVSLTERYARVVADTGLEIPQETWRALIAQLAQGLRSGDAVAALTGAAERMGDLLAEVFPAIPGASASSAGRFHML
jgi:putative membrane protein